MRVPERQVLHLGVAGFPVAVERVVDPSLRERPLVIAPPVPRARVLFASAEAGREGIQPGMRVDEARRQCRGLVLLPPNDPLYARAGKAVLDVAGRFSPVLEPRAHGCVYLDVTGTGRLFGQAIDVASQLRKELTATLRLEAAVGVAVNKLVSRVAADVTKPTGLLDVRAGDEAPFLAPLHVARLPGVGSVTARELKALNVRLVRQMALLEVEHLTLVFGRFGVVLHQRAQGIDPRPVRLPARRLAVHREATLPEDSNDPCELRATLRTLVDRIGRELRARKLRASRLQLEIRYADTRTATGGDRLAVPASLDAPLWRACAELFRHVSQRRTRVRGFLLVALGLVRESGQLTLFEDADSRREERVGVAFDRVREAFGEDAVCWGGQLPATGSRVS
jgi:DNA polymerase-4